jgi:putative two-component system response regulator
VTAGVVLVVDDMPENIELLRVILRRQAYTVHAAADGQAALDLVAEVRPDIVLTDVSMPVLDGFELCRRLKADTATRLIPVVLVTTLTERAARLEGINAGADDFLTKPVDPIELRARVGALVRLKRFTDDLDSAESMILSLGRTIEARDRATGGHCERMAAYAVEFGSRLSLPPEDLAALHRGGFLHDVGKVGVPDAILLKTGRLSDEERRVMETHTIIGDTLLGDLRLLRAVRPIVRHHHERLDGSGYPDRLSAGAVPLLAQIIAIVDVFDALTSPRSYRAPVDAAAAAAELVREAERGWHDRALVSEFVALTRRSTRPDPLA